MTARKKAAPKPAEETEAAAAGVDTIETTPSTPETEAPADEPAEAPAEEDTLSVIAPIEPPAEQAPAKAEEPEVKTPGSALVEPPDRATFVAPKRFPDDPTEVAAERLRTTVRKSNVTDDKGNEVDADQVFTQMGDNLVQCNVRLIEHAHATAFDRPVSRLLVAKGAVLTDRAAAIIKAQIAGEQAPGPSLNPENVAGTPKAEG